MRIHGAVLEASGRDRPYASSRPLTVAELDLAPPGPGEVLVELEASVDDLPAGQRVVLVFLPSCRTCAGCSSGGRRRLSPRT